MAPRSWQTEDDPLKLFIIRPLPKNNQTTKQEEEEEKKYFPLSGPVSDRLPWSLSMVLRKPSAAPYSPLQGPLP